MTDLDVLDSIKLTDEQKSIVDLIFQKCNTASKAVFQAIDGDSTMSMSRNRRVWRDIWRDRALTVDTEKCLGTWGDIFLAAEEVIKDA